MTTKNWSQEIADAKTQEQLLRIIANLLVYISADLDQMRRR